VNSGRIAAQGAEAYYPKKWTPLSYVMPVFLVISLAECFRQETAVRIMAVIAVLVFGALSFYSFRNLFLITTGKAYLKLSRDRVSFRYGKIHSSFAWGDIQGFSAVQIQDGKLFMVGLTLNDIVKLTENQKSDKMLASQMTQGRFNGILLPDQYNWKADELAAYLNTSKERYGSTTRLNIYEK
jgi:hypothetical protein